MELTNCSEFGAAIRSVIKPVVSFIMCLRGHDWTCAVEEGVEATPEQLVGGLDGFLDYATIYCRRCDHVYKTRSH